MCHFFFFITLKKRKNEIIKISYLLYYISFEQQNNVPKELL